MQAAKEVSLLAGLQAPLALLSPWSSLGVTAAAMPPVRPARLELEAQSFK